MQLISNLFKRGWAYGFFISCKLTISILEYLGFLPTFFKEGWTLQLFVANKSIYYWANLGTTNRE